VETTFVSEQKNVRLLPNNLLIIDYPAASLKHSQKPARDVT
jgi:hypothetical protein